MNDEDTKKPIHFDAIDYKSFVYYYRVWENYHFFGLPHGTGWIDEREWTLEFLKVFENAYNTVQNFIEQKAINSGV